MLALWMAAGETMRFDLAQVLFGRDAAGNFAAATDSKILAVLRWPAPPEAPPVEPFGIPLAAVEAAWRSAGRAALDRGQFTASAVCEQRGWCKIGLGERPGLLAEPPGKFPVQTVRDYERHVAAAVPLSRESRLAPSVFCQIAKLVKALNTDDEWSCNLLAVLPSVATGCYVFRLAPQQDGDADQRVTGWVMAMPLSDD